MLLCCRKAGTAAFWLVLSAALAAGAFVICVASSSPPEVTTMPATSVESPDSYLPGEEVTVDAEGETLPNGERSFIADIEKLKKVAEILQTVGETVIPVLIQNNAPDNSAAESIPNRLVNELAKTKIEI